MFLTQSTSSAAPNTLYSIDVSASPYTFTPIGSNPSSITYNAIGFNPNDGFIYGIRYGTTKLVQVSQNDVQVLGTVSGLPAPPSGGGAYLAGDMDNSGNLWLLSSGSGSATTIYKVDVTSLVATSVTTSVAVNGGDIAYNSSDGLFYGIHNGNSKLYSLDPATGNITFIGSAGLSGFGAMFGGPGQVFGNHNTGGFYQFNTSTGVQSLISNSPSASINDGAKCNNVSSSLPITLTSFTATPTANCSALLQWQTANELNSKNYIVQQSTDGVNFVQAASVVSKNDANGASYTYKLSSLFSGINYFRLKAIDADGKFTYSNITTVRSTCKGSINITPNPTNDIVNIAGLQGKNNIQIFNTIGQKITEVQSVNFVQQISLAKFAKGVYTLRIVDAQGVVTNAKVVKE